MRRRADCVAFFGVIGFVSGRRDAELLRPRAKASYNVHHQINNDIHGKSNATVLCAQQIRWLVWNSRGWAVTSIYLLQFPLVTRGNHDFQHNQHHEPFTTANGSNYWRASYGLSGSLSDCGSHSPAAMLREGPQGARADECLAHQAQAEEDKPAQRTASLWPSCQSQLHHESQTEPVASHD